MQDSLFDAELRQAARQAQFLEVIDRDEAMARFQGHLKLAPLGQERLSLAQALNRVLAENAIASVDVPGFDRANVDGFAVQALDTFGAREDEPVILRLNGELLTPGVEPRESVRPGTATAIATGSMLPRGADAVVMIEHTELCAGADGDRLEIRRAAAPGQFIAFAGSDIARGETAVRSGQLLTSREIGVLAAIGQAEVEVYRRPRIAIISTGNELIQPGEKMRPGAIYDSNGAMVAAAVEELGGEAIGLGIYPDDEARLGQAVQEALQHDMVILSGGTSKGAGDLSYRLIGRLGRPGILAHGVALKPGKPLCLAVIDGKPVVILPGFPTSAIFTFHEFVAPVIRCFAGLSKAHQETVTATLPVRVNSERGRTEYLLVGLVPTQAGLSAYPMGKGSGSVTAFSYADGFIAIGPQTELLEAEASVTVQLIGQKLEPADLVFIGSHCVGLDYLLTQLQRRGLRVKSLYVGSLGGLAAAKRGECDIAGIHLMDPQTGVYNRHLLTPRLAFIAGYRRMQGLIFRRNDARFAGKSPPQALAAALADPQCTLVNRNAGSGTRILIDKLLGGKRPPGYAMQAKSHNAVAAAIAQGRADWGIAIDTVARLYGLDFIPLQEERYDFVIPQDRLARPALRAFQEVLEDGEIRAQLKSLGFIL